MRLAVTELERRDTAGSLLDALMIAAFGGAPTDPLDGLPAFLDRPPLVGVGTGETDADAGAAFVPTSPPVFPDRSPMRAWLPEPESASSGHPATTADAGFVSLPIEDPLLFSLAPTAATPVPVAPAAGMQPTDAAAPAAAATGSAPSVGVSSAQPAPALVATPDAPILLRAPAAIAATSGTVGVDAGQAAQPIGSSTIIGGSGLPGPTVNAEYIADDLPPNTAPVAADDTATMDEDGGSVVIDVLANDTDEDGDTLLIDDWNWKPDHGTVTQTDDYKLEYTPFPDFNGTETFTYTATDGRDVSNSATVTVTVNSVNDAPVAFTDGFSVFNVYDDTDANGDGEITGADASTIVEYTPYPIGSVFANDIDYDGEHDDLHLVDLDLSTLPPGVWVGVDPGTGDVTIGGPAWFTGEVVFSYAIGDGSDASNPVTATIFLYGPLKDTVPGVSAYARPDTVIVGDGPAGVNVLENDDYAVLTVVASHPDRGRLSDFSGGDITLTPDIVPQDTSFTYTIFGPGGRTTAGAEVTVVALKMDLFNGQGGKAPVRAENRNETGGRVAVGAFTVVNRNDTDGDAVIDTIDGWVAPASAQNAWGRTETDLMKLRIYRPSNFGGNKQIRLTMSNDLKLYEYPDKFNKQPVLTGGNTLTFTPGNFTINGEPDPLPSLDYWVEVVATAATVRASWVNASYDGASYRVLATGVWATFDTPGGFHISGNMPAADADAKRYRNTFNSLGNLPGFTLGKPDMLLLPRTAGGKTVSYLVYLVNTMETEFTTTPTGIGKEPDVKFDLSRTIENRTWFQLQGKGVAEDKSDAIGMPAYRDTANDDSSSRDEDAEPTNNHIYQLDFPGFEYPITTDAKDGGQYNITPDGEPVFHRGIRRMNALEFVRIKVGGGDFTHPAQGVHGSRASELVPWHSWLDVQWNGNAWVRTANTAQATYNEIGLGIPWSLETPSIV